MAQRVTTTSRDGTRVCLSPIRWSPYEYYSGFVEPNSELHEPAACLMSVSVTNI